MLMITMLMLMRSNGQRTKLELTGSSIYLPVARKFPKAQFICQQLNIRSHFCFRFRLLSTFQFPVVLVLVLVVVCSFTKLAQLYNYYYQLQLLLLVVSNSTTSTNTILSHMGILIEINLFLRVSLAGRAQVFRVYSHI